MLFTWDDTYRTGIQEVDNQHMELFEIANKLHFAANSGKKCEAASDTINFLCKYVINHFYIEEGYQQRYNYPDYEAHKTKHQKFITELTDLKNEVSKNLCTQNLEKLSVFVVEWLKGHILKTDKEMGIYIRNNSDDIL